MRFKKRGSRLYSSILPLAVLLFLLAGQVLYSIQVNLSDLIYNNSKGKIEQTTPEDWDLPHQNVSFNSGGLLVKSWFIDNEDSSRAIIFAPGKGGNRWDILRNAPIRDLYKNDFDILLFDPRSTGQSEGESYGFGYFESQDIANAVRYLREEKSETEIGVWGGSAGASATIMAALETSKIDAIVADSPYANLRIAVSNFEKKEEGTLPEKLYPLYLRIAKFLLKVDLNKTKLTKRVRNLTTPIFLIHGLEDQVLAPKNSRMLYKRIRGPKRLWLVEEAHHVGSCKIAPKKYKKRVGNFFEKYLEKH